MGQALNLLADWAALNANKNKVFEENVKVLARWLSDAQVRHAEISRCLQKTWIPSGFDDEDKVALPDDFIRIKEDSIRWDSVTSLNQVPYEVALNNTITSPIVYSIHNGYLYIFGAGDDSEPQIVYEYRPTELTATSVKTEDLEIPAEFHKTLILYLDAMWARTKDDNGAYVALMDRFRAQAQDDGTTNIENRYGVPMMRASWL